MSAEFQPQEVITLPARYGKAVRLKKGEAVQVINLHGTQVVDCWAYNAQDVSEYMSMEATRVWNQRLNPRVGDSFITSQRHPILTLVADTSPGAHRNCHDNLFEAMRALGVALPHGNLASFNIFMNIQVQPDGITLKTLPVVTKPGDYIVLRAEMECFVAFSACPQDIVSIQGQGDNTPRDAELRILSAGFPQVPLRGPWVPA